MTKITIFTIASENYDAQVKSLFQSISSHNDINFICFTPGKSNSSCKNEGEFERIYDDVIIPEYVKDMRVRYSILEYCTAIKPYAFLWIFSQIKSDIVIYLDPDIFLFDRDVFLEEIKNLKGSVILTPHILTPIEDNFRPNDYHMLQAGTFNLGFMAARRCDEALMFIRWWADKLATRCYSHVEASLFTDQKWCDLAPSFLPNLTIWRHPGANIAYWNLFQRTIKAGDNGNWSVGDAPLIFFHFSGFDPLQPEKVSKHQDRLTLAVIAEWRPIFDRYAKSLLANLVQGGNNAVYPYDMIQGLVLNHWIRRVFGDAFPTNMPMDEIDRPFLEALCNLPANPGLSDWPGRVTRLMFAVHQGQEGLQGRFPLDTFLGRARYTWWFARNASRLHGFPASLTKQRLIRRTDANPALAAMPEPLRRPPRCLICVGLRLLRRRFAKDDVRR